MAKSQSKETKDEKNKSALIGRVRKAVRKSRRKLGEEKFEKELQRTISFLTDLRDRLNEAPVKPAKPLKPAKVKGDGKAKTANQKSAKSRAEAPTAATASLDAKALAKPKAPANAKAIK